MRVRGWGEGSCVLGVMSGAQNRLRSYRVWMLAIAMYSLDVKEDVISSWTLYLVRLISRFTESSDVYGSRLGNREWYSCGCIRQTILSVRQSSL